MTSEIATESLNRCRTSALINTTSYFCRRHSRNPYYWLSLAQINLMEQLPRHRRICRVYRKTRKAGRNTFFRQWDKFSIKQDLIK